MFLIFKATQWFEWYITIDRILTEIGRCNFNGENNQRGIVPNLLNAQFFIVFAIF